MCTASDCVPFHKCTYHVFCADVLFCLGNHYNVIRQGLDSFSRWVIVAKQIEAIKSQDEMLDGPPAPQSLQKSGLGRCLVQNRSPKLVTLVSLRTKCTQLIPTFPDPGAPKLCKPVLESIQQMVTGQSSTNILKDYGAIEEILMLRNMEHRPWQCMGWIWHPPVTPEAVKQQQHQQLGHCQNSRMGAPEKGNFPGFLDSF